MSEVMDQQTQEVLQQLQHREILPEQVQQLNRQVSKAHQAVIDRVDGFIGSEFDRVEQEIAQLERQLIEKLAERRELCAWFYQIGYRTGLQAHVEIDIEKER